MSSLPAISVNLEALKASGKGYAVISVPGESDRQSLLHPEGIQLIWVVDSETTQPSSALTEKYAASNGSREFHIHGSQANSRECET